MENIEPLVRNNIKALEAYASARSLSKSGPQLKHPQLLDANENPYNLFSEEASGLAVNRYPDGSNEGIRKAIGQYFNLPFQQVAVSNGSDEMIDMLVRIFCIPKHDELIICPPTFGMYRVSAEINEVGIISVPLLNYQLDMNRIKEVATEKTKILFICNPNNPTGTVINRENIQYLVENLNMMVVVDEAYADFMHQESMLSLVQSYPNLVVLRTLSKAYALAGARLGIAFSQEYLIALIQKIKFPYNINVFVDSLFPQIFDHKERVEKTVQELIHMRIELAKVLSAYEEVLEILPSDTNFLCVRFKNSQLVFEACIANAIITRRVPPAHGMDNMIRITVGSKEENQLLIGVLDSILKKKKSVQQQA